MKKIIVRLFSIVLVGAMFFMPMMNVFAKGEEPSIIWLSPAISDVMGVWELENGTFFLLARDGGYIIDINGKLIADLSEYDGVENYKGVIEPFQGGYGRVNKWDASGESKEGVINTSGEVIIPLEYEHADRFINGLALVGKVSEITGDMKYGYIDVNGEMVIPMEFDFAEPFEEELTVVGKVSETTGTEKYGLINTKGETVVPMEYDYALPYKEGFVVVGKRITNNANIYEYGYINTAGELVISMEYDYAGPFSEGLAVVGKVDTDGCMKYGYICTNGEVVIPFEYNYAGDFEYGLAEVTRVDADGNKKRMH